MLEALVGAGALQVRHLPRSVRVENLHHAPGGIEYAASTAIPPSARVGNCGQGSRGGDGGDIKWHNNQLLQKQLMEATLEDKRLSELCLQRAVQGPQIRMPERKRCGSWGSLKYLLFGIVPASLFIFALACALSHMKLEYPQ